MRWRLPTRRSLGGVFGSACFLVVFGGLFGGVPIGILTGASATFGPWTLLALPVVLPFALIGLVCVLLAFSLVAGRAEVQVANGQLITIERLGPLRVRLSRPADAVTRFEIKGGAMRSNGKALEASSGGEFSTLRAVLDGGKKPWPVASMYPHDTLEALAHELAEACDAQSPGALVDDGAPAVVAIDWRDEVSERTVEQAERPQGTPITLEQTEGVTTIRVPPAGSKGNRGILAFGILWEAFSAVATAGMVWKLVTNPTSVSGSPWVLAIVLPLFLGIGAVMIVYGLSLARRRTVLDVVGDTLLVTRSGLRQVRAWEWRAADLERVHVGPSGIEVNDEPVLALLIQEREGKKTVLLTERSEKELRWMAWEISRALGLEHGRSRDAA